MDTFTTTGPTITLDDVRRNMATDHGTWAARMRNLAATLGHDQVCLAYAAECAAQNMQDAGNDWHGEYPADSNDPAKCLHVGIGYLRDGVMSCTGECVQPAPEPVEAPALSDVRAVSHRHTVNGTTGPVKRAAFAHGYQAALADVLAAMGEAGPDTDDTARAALRWINDNGHDGALHRLVRALA